MSDYLLALDQGTTSTRAIVFDSALHIHASAQQEFAQHYPQPGWVEHDAEQIWQSALTTLRSALAQAKVDARHVAAMGITNQRETTVVWERDTGKPIYNAIVWQDRRTAETCIKLKQDGHEEEVNARAGLLLDPYFSATKIAWILDHVEGARAKAQNGTLAFGTIDCFLLWRLTGGKVHATDASNAARTALFNIHEGKWDNALLKLFNIPARLLPEVKDNAAAFGITDAALLGAAIPVLGMAGDQQAATIGQCCFNPGMVKSTYGTGCFALLNTGEKAVRSHHKLLTTIAYQLKGKRTYALEGSIFMAGATVQWLRDKLKIISSSREVDARAAKANPQEEVYLVPAFVGLGAPHWQAEVRAAIFGLTRGAGAEDICRAALEAVAYQTRELLEAMQADMKNEQSQMDKMVLRVDGGMAASDFTMQLLADMLDAPVERPVNREATAQGAAYLAGYQAGACPAPNDFAKHWQAQTRFMPTLDSATRARKWAGWQDAVKRVLM